jgi:hypothetical protein
MNCGEQELEAYEHTLYVTLNVYIQRLAWLDSSYRKVCYSLAHVSLCLINK